MHRLITMATRTPSPIRTITVALMTAMLLMFLISGAPGCATIAPEVRDNPEIEALRLRISKVRNAVEETRLTIAKSRGAIYLPELYLRLAELLSEEARYHYQLAFERERRASRDLYVPEVRLLKEEAIDIYVMALRRYPDTPLAPRYLFNMSHEYRELGDFDKMRIYLQRLIAEYPDSPLRFQALLVLGDNEFDKNELKEAERYYSQILTKKTNPVSGLALYKRAWVWMNLGDCKRTLKDFEDAITKVNELIEMEPNLTSSSVDQDLDVRRSSLVDLAYCFSRERKPQEAVEFFHHWAYDRPTLVAGLSRLATRFGMMEQSEGVILVTRELLRLGPSNQDRLDEGRMLFAALNRSKNYRNIGEDLTLLASAFTRYHTHISIDNEESQKLHDEFEVYARDLATRAHSLMQESKNNKLKASLASQLTQAYQTYLDTFQSNENLAPMLLNMAEVLAMSGNELQAGLRALQGAELLDDQEEKQNALYDSIVHLQHFLNKDVPRDQYDRVAARAALRHAGYELIGFDLEPDRMRQVKFAIAETYYDEGRYLEAIDKLSMVAYEFAGTEQSQAAIRLVLDSHNMRSDYDGLISASRGFIAPGSPAEQLQKNEIQKILAAAEQRKLDRLSLQAAGEDGGELSPLEDFAKIHQGTELGERALLNAFVAARAVGETGRMYALADEIASNYPHSDQLSGIYSTVAQTAVARFEYDRAVWYMQRAAEVNPDRRGQLLAIVGTLLEELGDTQQAERMYVDALNASKTSGARSTVLPHYATLVERQTTPRELISLLEPYEADGEAEVLVRLGLAQLSLGETDEGGNQFQRVLSDLSEASSEAQARAHYGLAEVMLATLRSFPELDDLDLIQDYLMLVEVTQQSYLNAARQASPQYTAISFSRLAHALRESAEQLRRVQLPSEIDSAQVNQIKAALDTRVAGLHDTADEALEACARRLWTGYSLDPVVKNCAQGLPWDQPMVQVQPMHPRKKVSPPSGLDELRDQLSRNPDNVDTLRDLGLRFLDAGDAHVARLVLARAVQAGGGPIEQNILGEASYLAGDLSGAFEAFAKAAEGGLEAGRQNLSKLLRQQNLDILVEEVFKRYPKGAPGGRLM